jgi:ATP-dependent Lhr-like helicase
VLERIHRATLERIRAEIEPCNDHEYAAFLLRWHHIGGVGLEAGERGVAAVLDQLSGLVFSPELWEHAILPARIPDYRPEYLDALCLSGEFAWVGSAAQSEATAVPARIAFMNRRALWPMRAVDLNDPDDPHELSVWRALVEGGAQYLDQVADRGNLSERDALGALWRLAARGRVLNDSFAPLRLFAAAPDATRLVEPRAGRIASRREAALSARLKAGVAGRWSAMARFGRPGGADTSGRPRELAMLLLRRHGVVAREVMALEASDTPWNEVLWALRRLEYAGAVRRGWFVRSLSGEQYALPAAVDMLRATRGADETREKPVALSAADPANPYGVILKGGAIAREASNVVVVRGGRVVLGLAARSMVTVGAPDDEAFAAAVAAILSVRARIVVDTIDGRPALKSSRVAALAAMRFHSDGRALVFDGLPGPTPAGARVDAIS